MLAGSGRLRVAVVTGLSPLDKLRLIVEDWGHDYEGADEALAQVERLAEAARASVESADDYWDWVTSYMPALREALGPFQQIGSHT